MVEKIRIGDYGAGANANSAKRGSADGTDEFSSSPG